MQIVIKIPDECHKEQGKLVDIGTLVNSLGGSDIDIYWKTDIQEDASTIIRAESEDKEADYENKS